MRNFIKHALTRKIAIRGSRYRKDTVVEISPSDRLIYGVYFATTALVALTALEIVYIVYLESFSSEIFAAITLVTGTILGAFFGQQG